MKGLPSFLMSCFLLAEKMAQLVLMQLVKVSSTGQVRKYLFHRDKYYSLFGINSRQQTVVKTNKTHLSHYRFSPPFWSRIH